ncbi:MAG: mechanosensitive ion channel family protein [Bryobacteraceae bacterium]
MDFQLMWGAVALAALGGVLWGLAREYRSRLRYSLVLLAACFVLLVLPQHQPWMHDAALALAQLIALHVFSILVFRILFHRFALPVIVSDIVVIVGYAVILLNLLAHLGVNVSGLIATSAVVAAVIGLALQELLVNLIGGLVLHADGAIHKGVWIKSEHGIGKVLNVRLRHTVILTPDNDTVLIPNHSLMKVPVTIISDRKRFLVRFRIGAGHRPTTVIRVVEKALRASPIKGIATDPKPECLVFESHPQHIDYGIHAWVTTPGYSDGPLSRVLSRAYFAMERAGIPLASIPTFLHLDWSKAEDDQETAATAALRQVPMWRTLTHEEFQTLGARLKRLSYAPGETIVRQCDSGASMFVILGGSVSVTLTGESGHAEELATLEPGSFFGEMSLMTGGKRTASVIALDEVECGELEKEDVADILIQRPELAQQISDVLEQRQVALLSLRERLQLKPGEANKSDLLGLIQEFFGLSKSRGTQDK